jgi:hypothetical protein
MAANKLFRFGPLALTTTLTTNLLNPPATTGGVNAGASPQFITLQRLRITNKTGTAATFSLWLGATNANAAGSEIIGTAISVPANSAFDWGGRLRIDATEFLVGGAGTAAALTIEGEGEIGVSG